MAKVYLVGITLALSVLIVSQTALAADIGVVRGYNLTTITTAGVKTKYPRILNAYSENMLVANKGNNELANTVPVNGEESTWSGDFLATHDGLEYLKTDVRKVEIFDASGNQLAKFKTAGKGGYRSLGVGDIFPDITGLEVLVCRQETKHAKILVYSYDETTNIATEQLTFTPFQDLVDRNVKHGCGDLGVITVDGETKIIATRVNSYGDNLHLYVYAVTGELEQVLDWTGSDNYGYNYIHFTVLDFTGDGTADDVLIDENQELLIYNLASGSQVASLDLSNYSGFDYAIGSIDDTFGEDVIYMYGKESNTFIMNNLGITEIGQLYPGAKTDRNRRIVVTDLSEFTQ